MLRLREAGLLVECDLAVEIAADRHGGPGIVAELDVVRREEIPAHGGQANVTRCAPPDRSVAGPIRGHLDAGQGTDVAHGDVGADGFGQIESILYERLVPRTGALYAGRAADVH